MHNSGFYLNGYDKLEYFPIDIKDGVGISVFSNVSFLNASNAEGSKPIPGDAFVIYLNEYSFFHNIQDILGQFLYLKSKFKNLEIVPVLYGGEHLDGELHHILLPQNIREILELLDTDINKTIRIKNLKEIRFERLIFLNAINNSFLNTAMSQNIWGQSTGLIKDFSYSDSYTDITLNFIKNFFRSRVEYTKTNTKIYITQTSNQERFEYVSKLLKDLRSNGVTWEGGEIGDPQNYLIDKSSELQWILGDISKLEQEVKQRLIDKNIEEKIVLFFKQNGYEIMDTKNMTILEQAKAFLSCSAIATNIGANSIHSLFLEPGDTFVMINVNPNYVFDHFYFVNKSINNPVFVFEPGKSQRYDIEYILENLSGKV